ncbi:MAG TPA: TetR/AcrR family transcriptional regulator [Acidimicrobiales bacterium]|nr:TetR/AcrR family transcriptional regulator [Acidimicrobiales bacterium]
MVDGTAIDGRVQRRVRNREAVVDAILDLLVEGHEQPTAALVAERSGVSMRSIFRLFDDMASLHRAAIARQAERVASMLTPLPDDGPTAARVAALVRNRAAVLEAISPVRRLAVRLASGSPPVAGELTRSAGVFRGQVEHLFRPELAGADPTLLDALDLATSWESWERLRATQGLDLEGAAAVVSTTVSSLLATRPPRPGAEPPPPR